MNYIIYLIIGFLVWWVINGIFVLKIKRPSILSIINNENWMKKEAEKIYKQMGVIEKTGTIDEKSYQEMMYNKKCRWVEKTLKEYGVTLRDIPKMIWSRNHMSFIVIDWSTEDLIVTTLWAIKLYWNFIGAAELLGRFNIHIMHGTEQKELLVEIEKEEYQVREILKKRAIEHKSSEKKIDHIKDERVAVEDCPF